MSTVINTPDGLREMREILIIVFGKIEFIGDLDKSNFNSIMGIKPDGSERKSEDIK